MLKTHKLDSGFRRNDEIRLISALFVTPAKAGVQLSMLKTHKLDSGFRRNDDIDSAHSTRCPDHAAGAAVRA
jgi:hypothetical protein